MHTTQMHQIVSTKCMRGRSGYKSSIIPFAYFDRVTVFKVLERRTSVKGRVHSRSEGA